MPHIVLHVLQTRLSLSNKIINMFMNATFLLDNVKHLKRLQDTFPIYQPPKKKKLMYSNCLIQQDYELRQYFVDS